MVLGALGENLLVLACYDKGRAPIIRGIVDVALYGGIYRTIAVRIYDFIDRHKAPPGDHLPDLLQDKLESKSGGEASLYEDVIRSIHAAKDGINSQYVMSQLETFIKRQSLRGIAIDLAKALQRDTEESLEEAERLLASATRSTLSVFDPGTRLSDKRRALGFLDTGSVAFPTGIPELDRRGFGPTRKELWLFIGNTKAGKSWALTHMAKMALMSRVKVLHITLEMSEARCAQRYMQSLFAISKRKETLQTVRFQKDKLNRISGFEDVRINPKLSMDDPDIREKLEAKIDKWALRLLDNIIVKQFPTGQLTMGQLTAYMDNLEATQQFTPDLLVVDYPDLFKLDKSNFRLAIDEVYKDLRGLGVARNMAVAVVSQSHRGAARVKQVGADNVAEAYSKISHADAILTYSQTEAERKLGLARLHVAGGRNDQDKITLVIAQNYASGQFAVDSSLMVGNYFGLLPEESDDGRQED